MSPALIEQEIRNQKTSAFLTTFLGVVLLLFLILWVIPKAEISPLLEEEKEEIFEIVGGGSMDFGDFNNGSGDVNNFHEASDRPADAPAPTSQPDNTVESNPTPTPQNDPIQPQEEIVTTEQEEVVTAPPPVIKRTPKPKVSEPKPVVKETKPVVKEKKYRRINTPQNKPNSNATFSTNGGSNHGNGTGIGNRGTPNSTVLNPNGLFSFGNGSGNGTGDGEGGLNGRRLLYHVNPKYDSQEEGKMKFKVTVNPEGEVVGVRVLNYSGQLSLKRSTESCIRKWKFSPNSSKSNQEIVVTFTFKLR